MSKLDIKEQVALSEHTTFRMGGLAKYFITVTDPAELSAAFDFAQSERLPVIILGGGSNLLVKQSGLLEAVVLKIAIPGFEIVTEDNEKVLIKIGAGEIWDEVVAQAVAQGWWGIEAMSFIPGTVGATPIQNVGAYGSELSDVFASLEAYEIAGRTMRQFDKQQCQFSYRESIFKKEAKNLFVIVSITIQLSKKPGQAPDYPGVKNYFGQRNITQPSLEEIRQAIIDIRTVKLPDPKTIASVGSFFKNPFVTPEHFQTLKQRYPDMVAYPMPDSRYKIGAGWILDALGYKGQQYGNLQFYPNNALVITNLGSASFPELHQLVENVRKRVAAEFGIKLEIEPIVV